MKTWKVTLTISDEKPEGSSARYLSKKQVELAVTNRMDLPFGAKLVRVFTEEQ